MVPAPASPPAPAASPVPPPPLFITDPPAAPSAPATSPSAAPFTAPPAAASDPGKFKLKPKSPASVPAAVAAGSATVPPLFLPDDLPATAPGQVTTPVPAFVPAGEAPGSRPAFDPIGRSAKPGAPVTIPHIKVRSAPVIPEEEILAPVGTESNGTLKRLLVVLAVLAVVGGGTYMVWPHLPAEFSVAGFTVRTKPGLTISRAKPGATSTAPTPSEALNKLAQVPANAINKAQDALAARRASGQDRVDAAASGEDLPAKTFGVPPAAPIKPGTPPAKATTTVTSVTTVAPGLSATTPVEAAPEATPEFRAYIVNARVSGVFQGNPARAVINGRLIRAGESVDAGLGITFDGIDAERRNLMFKDATGATVARRF
ncbi:MAG: hypothetical protein JNL92_02070 [Opitutaceae bacterium]|nr:hypothetical protein [Opitutaceae bacterium]